MFKNQPSIRFEIFYELLCMLYIFCLTDIIWGFLYISIELKISIKATSTFVRRIIAIVAYKYIFELFVAEVLYISIRI